MTKSTLAWAMRLDGEALRTQTRLELLLPRLRPDAENTSGRKRTPAAFDRLTSIEWIAFRVGPGVWPFEEIENDRFKGVGPVGSLSNAIRHIAHPHRYPRVGQTVPR